MHITSDDEMNVAGTLPVLRLPKWHRSADELAKCMPVMTILVLPVGGPDTGKMLVVVNGCTYVYVAAPSPFGSAFTVLVTDTLAMPAKRGGVVHSNCVADTVSAYASLQLVAPSFALKQHRSGESTLKPAPINETNVPPASLP